MDYPVTDPEILKTDEIGVRDAKAAPDGVNGTPSGTTSVPV